MSDSTVTQDPATTEIPGYDYGRPEAAHSPVSLEELRQIEMATGWTEEDAQVLHANCDIFRSRAQEMVDSWREAIAAQPHLAKWFAGPEGKADDEYKAAVKKRFVQWVVDTCTKPHDQTWLDYQEEIALRHMPAKKNRTDDAETPALVPLRFLIAFATVVTSRTRPFLTAAGMRGPELRSLEDAWAKTVQLAITLWSRPYVKEGLW